MREAQYVVYAGRKYYLQNKNLVNKPPKSEFCVRKTYHERFEKIMALFIEEISQRYTGDNLKNKDLFRMD
ncbi:MAG: hypothetical protein GF311_07890 [Candidatus Lokiarchaeota archaeon]|nr:hypothetical protein [Candidatus Lokiarchaeota archaeon]